jgi:hypothetical protein
MLDDKTYYKTSYTLPRLKVITLIKTYLPDKSKYEYKAIDDNGKVLVIREEIRTCKGTTFIAALITKNSNYLVAYSMKRMFSGFHRINTTVNNKSFKPYAIAVLAEHQEEYKEWLDNIDEHSLSNKVPT